MVVSLLATGDSKARLETPIYMRWRLSLGPFRRSNAHFSFLCLGNNATARRSRGSGLRLSRDSLSYDMKRQCARLSAPAFPDGGAHDGF